jgi:hypothetical protein
MQIKIIYFHVYDKSFVFFLIYLLIEFIYESAFVCIIKKKVHATQSALMGQLDVYFLKRVCVCVVTEARKE